MKVIARMRSDFKTKFGIPRQSGLAACESDIVIEPEFCVADAFRGLCDFSHIWLLWGFSDVPDEGWSPTVRPPRLGGNKRMGVFATRSPYRPNRIGLSCVELAGIDVCDGKRIVLHVKGADLMDGTPIYDIKPYLPYTDSVPAARDGFAGEVQGYSLTAVIPGELLELIPAEKREPLRRILENDPRPSYQDDASRVYGFVYAGFEIRFKVSESIITVTDIHAE